MILLVTTIVFAMALCGAVSAEDSQGGALNDTTTLQSIAEQTNSNSSGGSSEDDPRIYGVIKANNTPANGAVINIRNPTNNSIISELNKIKQ